MMNLKNDVDKTLNGNSESNSVGSPNSKNKRSVVIMKNKKKLSNKYLILSPSSKKLNLLSVKSLNNYLTTCKINESM